MPYSGLIVKIKSKCQLCIIDIEKDHIQQKFCASCAIKNIQAKKNKWKRDNYRKRLTVRICPICSVTFATNVARKKYCTIQCQGKAVRIQRYEKTILKLQNLIYGLRGQ